MAMTVSKYNLLPKYILAGDIDFATASGTIKVALYLNDFVFDATDEDLADVTGTELSDELGYDAGGVTLASKAVTQVGATAVAKFDAADVSWTFTGARTFKHALIYKSTGTAANDLLIAAIQLESTDITMDSGTYTIIWDSDGIFDIGYSS